MGGQSSNRPQNMIGEMSIMVTRTLVSRVLAASSLMVVFFARPAACQDTQGTSSRDESTRFDYSKGHGFRKLSSMRTASTATAPCGRRWSAFGSWQAPPAVTLIPHESPPHALPATIPFGWRRTMTGLRFHWKLLQSYGNGDENGPTLSCMVTSPWSPTGRSALPILSL